MRHVLLLAVLGACYRSPASSTDRPPPSIAAETTTGPAIANHSRAPAVRHSPYPALNVPYMLRGYFYAGSPIDEGLGGHATSDNHPRPNDQLPALAARLDDDVHIAILTGSVVPFQESYDGMQVVLVNPTTTSVQVAASDSRLPIVHEAIDATGQWRPIEYLPSSWCGNSYHTLTLPAGQHWELVAPRYTGPFHTKLRLRADVIVGGTQRTIYSNEIDGSIELAQFTEKQGHEPAGIMDPYVD